MLHKLNITPSLLSEEVEGLADAVRTVRNNPFRFTRVRCERSLSASVYPSGDFSVGTVPPKRKRQIDNEYERTKASIYEEVQTWEDSEHIYLETAIKKEKSGLPPNLVDTPKLSQPGNRDRVRYGLKGITGYGKKMLRSAAVLMEQKWGKYNCGMGTLTLPPISKDQLRLISGEWRDVCRRIFQEIGRDFKRRTGRQFQYAYCTEIQEDRSANIGIPVLHIHFLYRIRKWSSRAWSIDAGRVRSHWRRIIESYVGKLDPNMDCRVRLETVRKSCAGYIGKYLSKGGESLREWQDRGYADMLPSTWWGMSASLSKQIRAMIVKSMSAFADWLWQACRDSDNVILQWFSDVCIDIQGRETRVGYYGRADFQLCKELQQTIDSLCPT